MKFCNKKYKLVLNVSNPISLSKMFAFQIYEIKFPVLFVRFFFKKRENFVILI